MGRAFAAVGVAGPLEAAALRCFLPLLGLVVTDAERGACLLGDCGASVAVVSLIAASVLPRF
jgi:hypothetical protein